MSDPDRTHCRFARSGQPRRFAQVLAGAAVVLDPSFWPRVEAASAIVATGRARGRAGLRHQYRVRKTGVETHSAGTRRRCSSATSSCSHCCGVGQPTPEPIVRLMMALKIVSLGRGASGVRREVIEQLQAMLARRHLSAGAAAGIGRGVRRSGAARAYDRRHDRRGAGAASAGRLCRAAMRWPPPTSRRSRSAEGRPCVDQRYAVFERLCHLPVCCAPMACLRGAGDGRVVGRCGHGLDRAVSSVKSSNCGDMPGKSQPAQP